MKIKTTNRTADRAILYQRPARRRPMTKAEKIVARWWIGDRDGITEAEYRAALIAADPKPDPEKPGGDDGKPSEPSKQCRKRRFGAR